MPTGSTRHVEDSTTFAPVRLNTPFNCSSKGGSALHLYPGADGPQHCEVAGMRDTLDDLAAKLPKWRWLQNSVGKYGWEVEIREIKHDAPVHPSVQTRFALPTVVQCAGGSKPYRPDALRQHDEFKKLYEENTAAEQLIHPADAG